MRHGLGVLMVAAAILLADCDGQPQTAAGADKGVATAGQAARMVIAPRFDEAGAFSEGLAAVRVGAKFGYIDTKGNIVIMPQFDHAGLFSEGLASAGIGDKNGYIDKQGMFVITPKFEVADLFPFSEGLAAVRIGDFLSGKWGFIDKQGEIVVKPQFDGAGSFHDGLAVVGLERKWGYI